MPARKKRTSNPSPFPEGTDYLELIRGIEDACYSITYRGDNTEERDTDKLHRLGNVLSLLYRLSCCHWGCHEKEHVIEYLSGRTVTSAHGALRLIGFGYYDEALALIRNISEIGNLVHLFFVEPSNIRSWLDATDQGRRREYSPVAVRRALKRLGPVVPTDQEQYAWLCEVATHVTPRTRPGSHNDVGQPILGGVYQAAGFKTAIESLAWSVCTVAGPVAKIAVVEREQAERLVNEVIQLVERL